jgi:hypothetical protein
MLRVEVSPGLIIAGLKLLFISALKLNVATFNTALAGKGLLTFPPFPVVVNESALMVFVKTPACPATTSTETVHNPSPVPSLAGTPAPLKLSVLSPEFAVTEALPQFVLTGFGTAATNSPVGNVSTQLAFVRVKAFGFEILILRVDVPPRLVYAGKKLFISFAVY